MDSPPKVPLWKFSSTKIPENLDLVCSIIIKIWIFNSIYINPSEGRHTFVPALCHVLFTFCFCVLYTKGELRRKKGKFRGGRSPRRGNFAEGNLRGGEFSWRGIFAEGHVRRGMFGEEFSLRSYVRRTKSSDANKRIDKSFVICNCTYESCNGQRPMRVIVYS